MGIEIGIDIGGSTTKIIGLRNAQIVTPLRVKANDPVTSMFGAFGKFIDHNKISLSAIERIMITGVGASYIDRPIYGIHTGRVAEFLANGLGGLYITGLKKAIIVSMGTGTSLVKADEGHIEHIGGTGIGGGTILGLADRLLNIRTIEGIIAKAEEGDLKNVDLMVGDITKELLPGLPPDTTASNFGKINDRTEGGDIALGILNLVFQCIGTNAIFAAKNTNISDVVLIGNLSIIPQCREVINSLKNVSNVNFIMPENSEYATAVGAALAYGEKEISIIK